MTDSRLAQAIGHRAAFVAGLAGLLLALPSLAFPIGWDQGVYGLAGKAMLRHLWCYRGFLFDTKAPPIHLLFAAVYAFFGNAVAAYRALDVLILASGAFFLFRLLNAYVGAQIASVASSLYVFLACYRDAFWSRLQAETAIEPVLFLSFALAARGARGRQGRALGAGAALGLCAAFKITLLFAALPLLLLLGEAPRGARRRILISAAAGWILLFGAFLLVCLPCGLLREVFQAHVAFAAPMDFDRYGGGKLSVWGVLDSLWRWGRAVAPAAGLLALVSLLRLRRSRLTRLLVVWALAIEAAVIAQGRFIVYHYSALLPPIAAGAALAFFWAFRAGRRARRQESVGGRAALAIAGQYLASIGLGACLLLGASRFVRAAAVAVQPASREAFAIDLWRRDTPFDITRTAFDEHFKAVRLIEEITQPEERLLVADGPLILFLAGRQPCDRYVFFHYWIYALTEGADKLHPALVGARQEIIQRFETCRPPVAVFVERRTARYPEIQRRLERDYVRLHGYQQLWVYVRKDRLTGAASAGPI